MLKQSPGGLENLQNRETWGMEQGNERPIDFWWSREERRANHSARSRKLEAGFLPGPAANSGTEALQTCRNSPWSQEKPNTCRVEVWPDVAPPSPHLLRWS